MSEQFWYGLLALPVAVLAVMLVWLFIVKIWDTLARIETMRVQKLNKVEAYSAKYVSYVSDHDNRLEQAALIATAENVRVWNVPFFGVFIHARGRIDGSMARKIRDMMKDKMIQNERVKNE